MRTGIWKFLGILLFGISMGFNVAAQSVTYFHNDISGSPMAATDVNGDLVWKENYRPYGDRLNNAAASASNKIWFAGRPYDNNTGLSYMGARYYDPVLGRFIGVDPKGANPEDLHSLNRYAYANNNPYKFVDPDGHSPIDVAFLIYDLGKLGYAFYQGEGVGHALLDVAMSTVGVVSPIPGAGQALKAARVVEHGIEGARGVEIGSKIVSAKAVSSRVKESPKLVKEAEIAGKSHQEGIDRLVDQLRNGNLNPGIGTKPIGSGLSEARARDGARVYFKETETGVEILGKSSKANQDSVIKEVLRVFGN